MIGAMSVIILALFLSACTPENPEWLSKRRQCDNRGGVWIYAGARKWHCFGDREYWNRPECEIECF